MPICGQVLRFASPLQVEPAAEMTVIFNAKPQQLAQIDPSLWYGLALFGVLLFGATALHWMRGPWRWLKDLSVSSAKPVDTTTPATSEKQQDSADRDDQDRQLSSEELL